MVINGARATEPAVWASAARPNNTGVGVIQREVYTRLAARGTRLVSPAESPIRVVRAFRSFVHVVGPRFSAALVCATPAPLAMRVPVVMFVYDLRWRRTRGPLPRLYRYLDLRRTAARADHIFTISKRTRDEMVTLFPGTGAKSTVQHCGPGIMGQGDFVDGEVGAVLLAGGARHKRNELVATAFAQARPDWAMRFLCVGVSDATFHTLVDAFGVSSCERFENVDDDLMRAIFQRAQVYVTASIEEGFGLPMVEALAAGCQVVAIRQPLTVEIMSDAAVLMDDGSATEIAQQLQTPLWVGRDVRLARSSMFSWDEMADAVATVLDRLVSFT